MCLIEQCPGYLIASNDCIDQSIVNSQKIYGAKSSYHYEKFVSNKFLLTLLTSWYKTSVETLQNIVDSRETTTPCDFDQFETICSIIIRCIYSDRKERSGLQTRTIHICIPKKLCIQYVVVNSVLYFGRTPLVILSCWKKGIETLHICITAYHSKHTVFHYRFWSHGVYSAEVRKIGQKTTSVWQWSNL